MHLGYADPFEDELPSIDFDFAEPLDEEPFSGDFGRTDPLEIDFAIGSTKLNPLKMMPQKTSELPIPSKKMLLHPLELLSEDLTEKLSPEMPLQEDPTQPMAWMRMKMTLQHPWVLGLIE